MKKFLAALLAVLFIFSFAACGEKTPATEDPTTDPVVDTGAPEVTEVRGVTIPKFSIEINGIAITNEDMAAYPVYSCECKSVNSKGNENTAVYQGFALADVCDAAGLKEQYTWASAEATDGYTVEFAKNIMDKSTMLAITKDGAQFKEAPWFAPCSTETSGDILSGCAKIFVNTKAEMPSTDGDASGKPEIKDATANVTFADFSFKVNGEEVNNAKLADLHIYKIKVSTTNSKGETSECTYTGYKLADVLSACGVENATSVKAVADDGYESELAAGQIASDWTLLAIEKDKTPGENGTIWLAPCESELGNVYARNVIEVVAK